MAIYGNILGYNRYVYISKMLFIIISLSSDILYCKLLHIINLSLYSTYNKHINSKFFG